MEQQFLNPAGTVRGPPREYVLQGAVTLPRFYLHQNMQRTGALLCGGGMYPMAIHLPPGHDLGTEQVARPSPVLDYREQVISATQTCHCEDWAFKGLESCPESTSWLNAAKSRQ